MKTKHKIQSKSKPAKKLKSLFVYNDLVTGQRRFLVPIWGLVLLLLAVVIAYLSFYRIDFLINLMGSSLNYFLPIFYIFIIISYFIILVSGQLH